MTEIKSEIIKQELSEIIEISKQQFGSESWTAEQFESSFNNKNSIFIVAKQNEKVVSFLVANDVVDSINLLLIATENSFKRRGYAKKLIETLLAKGKKVWLEVKETNIQAIALYESLDFKFLYERKKYYKDGQNALIFEKDA